MGERLFGIRNINQILDWLQTHSHLPLLLPNQLMSEEVAAEGYRYNTPVGREGQRERSGFQAGEEEGALAQRRDMDPQLGQTSEGSDSSHDRPASPHSPHQDRTRPRQPLHHDVEMGGSGSSGSGTESHGNESHGNESVGSSSGNCKDSALLESSASNKSSNSHSPSPPSSSNAFSLVSSEQDNPSTSGCSSEQSAKAKTQKELFKTLKQLKTHLPSEKRSKCKSSTLNTLKYALRCVKQVKANEEYYQMMMMINDSQPPGLDVSSYTTEEISSITSEYTLKKNDIFAVAVSLITGKIVYISDQAESILNCKLEVFGGTKFVEFLTPQDVSVFYSFTSPYRLPSWSMCTGAESSPAECMQEKSFFCRISGGKEREGDLQYYPFRMTPYLMKVQEPKLVAEQFCCLLLAERVHSGYEAPRIPTDKRIFTTTHTPSCVFQDVDEKAVPLLGYLPQDLIGSPVLLKMHPSDRPLMLAVHRKILQYGSQPFDHSSIRFCARNGEYVTLDTSWSSFVNPWSRKVSFVIGRHKVRMGPVNEDVFAVPAYTGGKIMDSDIQEITEQIHRLLLQPVHRMGSSGYGSNGSHEQHLSVGSSSESNGHGHGSGNAARSATGEPGKAKPRTFQEICKGVSLLKNQDPHVYLASPSPSPHTPKPEQRKATDVSQKSRLKESLLPLLVKDSTAASVEDLIYKDQSAYSYQQISCLDSVMRYLESCNIPITVKRKYQFSSNTNSSDEDKKGSENHMEAPQDGLLLEAEPGLSTMKAPKKLPPGAPMAALTLPSKAESVVSITSQCSYSSTIVHVGDKKPQPESEMIEDAAESPAPPALPVCVVSPPAQEKESYKRLGLTKQVLAAHTQKEEQAFLMRCRELRNATTFQKDCSTYLHKQRGPAHTGEAAGTRGATRLCSAQPETSNKKGGRNRKSKKPRMKRPDSSDSAVSNRKPRPPLQGLNQTSWSPSEASQSAFNVPYPAIVPAYPLSVYPAAPSAPTVVAQPDPSLSTGFGEVQANQAPPAVPHYPTPMVPPVVALVLPNYLFPQIGQMASAPRSAFFPEQPACQSQPAYATPLPFQTPHAYAAQPPFSAQSAYSTQQPFQNTQTPFATLPTPSFPGPQTAYSTQPPFATTSSFPVQTRFVSPAPYPSQVFPYALSSEQPKGLAMEPQEGAAWRCSTPASLGREPPASPPLFESRCSSPLQLNLLSMEETQRSAERFDITAPTGGTAGYSTAEKASPGTKEDLVQTEPVGDGAHSDGHSSSSDLLDILFHQDSHSGTGSATSESLDSGSRLGNGSGTLASRVSGNRTAGSSNTSKFFDCVDCLEHDSKTNPQSQLQAGGRRSGSEGSQASRDRELFQFVPQEPHWLLMANADDNVMMTYELPPRDIQQVLWEDKNRLRQMQKSQPHFTSDQRRELVDEHPWMRRGGLPSSINVQECLYCLDAETGPGEEDLPGMETNPQEVGNHQATAPEEPRPGPEPVH